MMTQEAPPKRRPGLHQGQVTFEDRAETMRAQVAQGMDTAQIAAAHGINGSSVRTIMKRAGIDGKWTPRKAGMKPGAVATADRAEQIKALVAQGLNVIEIAAAQGISRDHVGGIMRKYGIPAPATPRRIGLKAGTMLAADRAKAIRKLVAEGHSTAQIAALQGVSESRVVNVMQQQGIARVRMPPSGPTAGLSPTNLATETINVLIGTGIGIGMLRNGDFAPSKELAIELSAQLYEAMKPIRWLESLLREKAHD